MALILAIELGSRGRRTGSPLPEDLSGHELARATSLEEALELVAERAPDLIVFPLTLSRSEQAALAVKARRPDGHHLDSLVLPLRAAIEAAQHGTGDESTEPRWFYWRRPTSGPLAPERCDAVSLASAIRARFEPPREVRARVEAVQEDRMVPRDERVVREEREKRVAQLEERVAQLEAPREPEERSVREATHGVPEGYAAGARAFAAAGAAGMRAVKSGGASTLKLTKMAGATGARAAKLAGSGGVRLAKLAGAGGARAAVVAGKGSLRVFKGLGTGAAKAAQALKQIPDAWPRANRPTPNRDSMPAEERIQIGRSRIRKYTAVAALFVFALPPAVMWRSEILTFASGLGVVEQAEPAQPMAVEAAPAVGSLEVTSNQATAAVIMGGKVRGTAPTTIEGLEPGTYRVTIETPAGNVTRSAVVKANETTTLDGSVYPGWLALFAPFELHVVEKGRRLNLDEQNRVMLSPGRHELELVNLDLGYREKHVVNIEPGETTPVSLGPARSALSITTNPPAEIWIDGETAGMAPLANRPIDVGVHEILIRHPELGERRRTVTVKTGPLTLALDLTQPEP